MTTAADTPIHVITVVLVAHNSKSDLALCLPSILSQDVDTEIIVVDNSSTDGIHSWLSGTFPSVRVVRLPVNTGYAAGNNAGIRAAKGNCVLILNPDTVLHPGALREMLRVAEENPRSFVTPKLLQVDGWINTCGNQMHFTGITTCVGLGHHAATYTGTLLTPLLSGAAILATRGAWLELGGFDEAFFLYMEDADLSLRARLRGYDLLCAADAIVTHRYRPEITASKLYFLERNRLLTVFKNFESQSLRSMAPALCLTEIATWAYAVLRGPSYVRARLRGYGWLWAHRKEWRAARTAVQSTRVVSDRELAPHLAEELPFRQLVTHPVLRSFLERVTTPVYHSCRPRGLAT